MEQRAGAPAIFLIGPANHIQALMAQDPMQTSGENQTPSTYQSEIAFLATRSKASQPKACALYNADFMPHNSKEYDGKEKYTGTPRVTARRVAREKWGTGETEMGVLARHMLIALQRHVV